MAESADHKHGNVSEWLYNVDTSTIQDKNVRLTISPEEEDKPHLERRLEIKELNSVVAKMTLKRLNRRVIKVSGTFAADITQECVVTLQPVKNHLEDSFETWYADPEQAVSFARARHERDKEKRMDERPMLDEKDDPEPIIDGKINLGEIVTQYLSLAIDPFPRSEEAKKMLEESNDPTPAKVNPFAALKALKEEK